MITAKDIVEKYLNDNGYDGLWNDEGPCGCDGSAPCGDGPYPECCAAHKGAPGVDSNGDWCDFLYYPDRRTMDQKEADDKCHAREFSSEELKGIKL